MGLPDIPLLSSVERPEGLEAPSLSSPISRHQEVSTQLPEPPLSSSIGVSNLLGRSPEGILLVSPSTPVIGPHVGPRSSSRLTRYLVYFNGNNYRGSMLFSVSI